MPRLPRTLSDERVRHLFHLFPFLFWIVYRVHTLIMFSTYDINVLTPLIRILSLCNDVLSLSLSFAVTAPHKSFERLPRIARRKAKPTFGFYSGLQTCLFHI